jgi:hypothetical protein
MSNAGERCACGSSGSDSNVPFANEPRDIRIYLTPTMSASDTLADPLWPTRYSLNSQT